MNYEGDDDFVDLIDWVSYFVIVDMLVFGFFLVFGYIEFGMFFFLMF